MINPPAPPEIPKPTIDDFNNLVARKAQEEEQVRFIHFYLFYFFELLIIVLKRSEQLKIYQI